MPDPSPNTRQHERGVNKRRQRIRTRKPGSQAKPRGFGPVSKPMIFQLENGRKSQKSKNVRHMRGLRHGDGVHKNEAGISEGKMLAPRHGFEPRFTAPKAAVLPLDDRGISRRGRELPV